MSNPFEFEEARPSGVHNDGGDEELVAYSRPLVISPKSRGMYMILALLCGGPGIHNFYADRTSVAVMQLLLSLVSIPLFFVCGLGFVTIFLAWGWAFVDLITVRTDGKGRIME